MPTVRQYTRQVQPNALPGVRRSEYRVAQLQTPAARVTPTAESLGAGFGQTVASIGEQLYAEEQHKQDQIRLLDADNQAGQLENQLMYDPKTGALNQKGQAAFGLPDQVGKSWDDGMGKIRQALSNDRQRMAFDQYSMQKRQSMMDRLQQHVTTETYRVDGEATEGKIENETQAAIADGRPQRIAQAVDSVAQAYTDYGGRYGIAKEQTQAAIAKATTRIHLGVIGRMLDNGNDIQAKVYYEHAQEEILPEQRGGIEKALELASTEGGAMRAAQSIFQKNRPTADTGAFDIEAMSNAAREMFPNDPKLAKATIQNLKEMQGEYDSARTERASAAKGKVWSAIADNGDKMTLQQLSAMPEYRALPGPEQEQARANVIDKGEHLKAIDRSNQQWDWALQSHGWTLQEHARTQADQRDEDQAKSNWAAYWDYSQPDKLDKMSEGDIMGLTPKLGRVITGELMKAKRSLVKADEKSEGLVGHFDEGLFRELAGQAGLDAYAPSTVEEKAQLGQLHNRLNEIIGQEETTHKRKLNLDEQRKVGQSEIDRKVDIPGTFFGSTTLPAAIVKPEDRDQAFIPMEKIPPETVTAYINRARSLGVVDSRTSDTNAQSFMKRRIERAYALRAMGGSTKDIEDVLTGKR